MKAKETIARAACLAGILWIASLGNAQEPEADPPQVPLGPPDRRVPVFSPQAENDRLAAESVRDPASRLYVEYDGTKYPLYGWTLRPDGAERVDQGVRQLESVDPGRRLPLSGSGVRSDARFIEVNGKAVGRPEFLLPAPNEPSDVFHSRLDAEEMRLGTASRLLEAVSPGSAAYRLEEDILTRIRATASLGIAHNTGFNSNYFDVTTIALGKDRRAGQTRFFGGGDPDGVKLSDLESMPLSLLFDNQIMNIGMPGAEDSQLQVYLEANNAANKTELDTPHLYARLWDKDLITITAGKTYSLFSNRGLTPTTLQGGGMLIGSSSGAATTVPQFRIQRGAYADGGWGGGLALEDSIGTDIVGLPADATRLSRWPGFSGNLIYQGDVPENFVQFAATQKTIGCQLADGSEQFESCFGLAAYSQLLVAGYGENRGALFMGVAGGDGIGNQINGIGLSGILANSSLVKLEGLGAYIGYGQKLVDARGWRYAANCAMGYATLETPGYLQAALPDTTNSELHQAWANFMVVPYKQMALGVEWQYGRREVRSGQYGEDNQFMFVLVLTTKSPKSAANSVERYDGTAESMLDAEELRGTASGQAYRQAL